MPKGPKIEKYSRFETTQPVLSYLSAKLASIWSPVRNVTVLFFTYLLSPPLSVCEKLHKLFSYCFPCKMSFICGLYVNDNLAVLHLSPWLYIVSLDFTNAKSQWGQKWSQLVREKTWRTAENRCSENCDCLITLLSWFESKIGIISKLVS